MTANKEIVVAIGWVRSRTQRRETLAHFIIWNFEKKN